MKDPLRKIKNRSRNKRTEGTRLKALAEGIEIGKQESADKIEEQKEQINRLSEQLALEAAHLLLANQRSDLRARLISTLTADADRQREENTRLEQRVALLTGQLAQKTEEIETVTADNARLRAQVAELAKPRQHSSYLNISIPRKTNAGDGSV